MRNEIFIQRLKEAMEAKKFNQASLSSAAGLGQTYVRDLLVGRVQQPGAEKLRVLANVLGISTTWLLGEDQHGLSEYGPNFLQAGNLRGLQAPAEEDILVKTASLRAGEWCAKHWPEAGDKEMLAISNWLLSLLRQYQFVNIMPLREEYHRYMEAVKALIISSEKR